MKKFKILVTLLVVMSIVSVLAGSAYAVEKQAKEKAGKSEKSGLININTAGSAQLQKLPRIGPKMAERILDHRTKHGKFKKIQDLMKVSGIGEKTFKGLEDMVTI